MITLKPTSAHNEQSSNLRWAFLRILLIDFPLLAIFTAYIAALTVELIHMEYLKPLKNLKEEYN